MKLKLTRPSKRRAKRVGTTFGAIGTFLGGLPVTVRPGKPDRNKLLRILIPASILGAVVAGIAQRRRARAAVETWSSEEGSPADAGFDPTTGGSGNSTGTESAEAGTQTERRKDEVEGKAGSEGVTETARGAAGETPASSEAGGSEAS
jgi:hypothetical protein